MRQKGFAQVLVIVLLLVLVGGVIYYFNIQKGKPIPSTTPVPTSAENEVQPSPTVVPTTEPITSWKTYTNTPYGYSVKYPKNWTVDSKNSTSVRLDENRNDGVGIFNQQIGIDVYLQKGNLTAYQFVQQIFYGEGGIHDPSLVNNNERIKDTSTLTDVWLKSLKTTPVTINGIQMTKIDELMNLGGSYGPAYWVSHNGNGYFILFVANLSDSDKTPEPGQILSTFKFTQ